MRAPLDLKDEHGTILSARQTETGVKIYNAVGGRDLTPEQVKQLTAWLDDGASSVDRAEYDRQRRLHQAVREDVARLVEALKGAWWIEAAGAYARLAEWAGR